jgi:hypothetical protein
MCSNTSPAEAVAAATLQRSVRKIELDAERFRTREGRVRRDFLQNIKAIPNVSRSRAHASAASGSVEKVSSVRSKSVMS